MVRFGIVGSVAGRRKSQTDVIPDLAIPNCLPGDARQVRRFRNAEGVIRCIPRETHAMESAEAVISLASPACGPWLDRYERETNDFLRCALSNPRHPEISHDMAADRKPRTKQTSPTTRRPVNQAFALPCRAESSADSASLAAEPKRLPLAVAFFAIGRRPTSSTPVLVLTEFRHRQTVWAAGKFESR